MDKYLKFAIKIAKKTKKIMLKNYKKNNIYLYKKDKTIVSKVDNEINDYLIRKVKLYFPSHAVIGEEKKFGKSNYTWVCDPIDGTEMFVRHIPVAMFSLALVVNGEPIVSVVMDPFNDIMYTAIKGKGAYKNGKRIRVNDYRLNNLQFFGHCDNFFRNSYYDMSELLKYLALNVRFNDIGSIVRAGCCIADGNYSFAIFSGTKDRNCDIAAIKLIVEEAGGKVTDLFGNEQKYDSNINGAVISNGVCHNEIINFILKYLKINKK